MCAKPWDVKTYVENFEKCKIPMIHYDVMDGNYVPNISIGPAMYKAIHDISEIPLNLHLMVQNPDVALDYFDVKKSDYVSFHPDTLANPALLTNKIRLKGCKAGIAISPKIPLDYIFDLANDIDFVIVMGVDPGFSGQKMFPDTPERVNDVVKIKDQNNLNIEIFVDGDCKAENAKKVVAAGADGCIVGSALINDKTKADDFEQTLNDYLNTFKS